MDAIRYITDEKGERQAVIIDLERYREAWELIREILETFGTSSGQAPISPNTSTFADAEAQPRLPLAALSRANQRLFASPDDIDAFINAERDAWER